MRALLLVSWSLLLWTASAQSSRASSPPTFAFTHVTVIDMTGAAPKPDMTVVITGNRIAAIGPTRTLHVPRGAPVRDATGKFLIPGLWDMHVHATWAETFPTFGPLFLVNGVTGIRDMWGRLDLVAGARIRLAQHRPTEPRIVVAGAMLDGDPPFLQGSGVASSPEQGRRAVDSLEALGVDFIKVNSSLKPDVFAAVMAEAKRLRIPLAGHATITVDEHEDSRRMFAKKLELVGLMHRRGVPLLAGTDVLNPFVFPGFAIHDELALLVEAGLTPMEALQTGTRNPAIFLHTSDSLGTIARGKIADLVLFDADPIADIKNIARINAVLFDGRLIDHVDRQQMLDQVRLRVGLPIPK